jgi:cbb3-type cytochrome oxidase maturation protein
MSVMIILLGASLIVALIFLGAFIWSVRSGQFEDDFSPAHKILFEDKTAKDISKKLKINK